jgi:hypothetical protein
MSSIPGATCRRFGSPTKRRRSSPSRILIYEEVRNSASPTETLLRFMESVYQARAKSAGWDIEVLRTHPPTREAAKPRRGD